MSLSTLTQIQEKIRRIVRSPSVNEITDAQLNQYINTFISQEFPQNIRLFFLRTVLTFYTQPNIDTYETNTINANDPLFNFKNKYTAIHQPVYMAGVKSFYTQYRDQFYGLWPQTNTIGMTGLFGNATTGPFTGTVLAHPILQNSLSLTCLDTAGASMVLVDQPIIDLTTGLPGNVTGNLVRANGDRTISVGTINYITGAFTIAAAGFPNATQTSAPIYAETISYNPGKPISMLFYNQKFIIRPVPDKAYTINIEADIVPTELLANNAVPEISQWWQYIALGTSLRIFEDRADFDSYDRYKNNFLEEESRVLRSSLTQQANMRSETIYTSQKVYGSAWLGTNWPF